MNVVYLEFEFPIKRDDKDILLNVEGEFYHEKDEEGFFEIIRILEKTTGKDYEFLLTQEEDDQIEKKASEEFFKDPDRLNEDEVVDL